MLKRITILSTLSLILCISHCAFAENVEESTKLSQAGSFADRGDVQKFIQEMQSKHKFNAKELSNLFKTISSDPKVLQAMSKPFEEVSWTKYKERFVNDERATKGVEFWRQNETALAKAEAEFGVPAEVIVAIIGVETRYGRNTGHFSVLQSLATLAFDYPRRAQFFRGELEEFLLLVKEEKLDPQTTMGSFAGAMGIPQFIPSSYRRYAVDFTGSGRRDLIHNVNDAIGSVANYFKSHGWQMGEKVALPATANGGTYAAVINTSSKDPVPKMTLAEFAQYNIQPKDKEILSQNSHKPAAFIILDKDSTHAEQWLTFKNFYVITRYNHSVNYAMAVYQLSQKIRNLKNKA